MKFNFLSVTFWFNIYNNHSEIFTDMKESFSKQFTNLQLNEVDDNLLNPIIVGYNDQTYSSFSMTQINFQYNIENFKVSNIKEFSENTLLMFEFLTSKGIDILHSAVFINGEFIDNQALKTLSKSLISSKILTDDLVDMTLKFGKKQEDLFYKIISVLNKKQLKIPKVLDSSGRELPLPLISWKTAEFDNEIIEISYEINDKYLFDNENNYHTTEFHINKMLYLLEHDFQDDIDKLLKKGEF